MKNLSGQESLWVAFPILLVMIILIAGLIFLPRVQTEIRGKAASPTPSIITPPFKQTPSPEIICSDLYTPVCGSNSKTYSNPCEANLAGITRYGEGICITPSVTTPGSTSTYFNIPTSN
ncbi:TPA: hypothetical protein DIU27_04785 [Candidatus Collierbacteria bacterium]|nr:hypothetical protein [Candidatus Collierbacteria bacterium]